jgi:hypothetical protein
VQGGDDDDDDSSRGQSQDVQDEAATQEEEFPDYEEDEDDNVVDAEHIAALKEELQWASERRGFNASDEEDEEGEDDSGDSQDSDDQGKEDEYVDDEEGDVDRGEQARRSDENELLDDSEEDEDEEEELTDAALRRAAAEVAAEEEAAAVASTLAAAKSAAREAVKQRAKDALAAKDSAKAAAKAAAEAEAAKAADGLVAEARTHYASGTPAGYARAIECYTKALAAAASAKSSEWAGKAKCLGNRSACFMMLGQVHPAIEDCRTALSVTPNALKIRNRLGGALLKVGSLTQSNEAYETVRAKASEIRKLNGGGGGGGEGVSAAEASRLEADAKEGIQLVFTLKDCMEQAYAAQRKGAHEAATLAAGSALQIAPHDHKMYCVRATAHYKHRRWSQCVDECVSCARAVAQANPKLVTKLLRNASTVLAGHLDESTLQALKDDATRPSTFKAHLGGGGAGSSFGGVGAAGAGSIGFGAVTAGRLLNAKMTQLLVPALRYSERCGEAEQILRSVAVEQAPRITSGGGSSSSAGGDEALVKWCVSEVGKIESLRQGKESGDAAFRRGKYHASVALYSEALGIDSMADSVNAVL